MVAVSCDRPRAGLVKGSIAAFLDGGYLVS